MQQQSAPMNRPPLPLTPWPVPPAMAQQRSPIPPYMQPLQRNDPLDEARHEREASAVYDTIFVGRVTAGSDGSELTVVAVAHPGFDSHQARRAHRRGNRQQRAPLGASLKSYRWSIARRSSRDASYSLLSSARAVAREGGAFRGVRRSAPSDRQRRWFRHLRRSRGLRRRHGHRWWRCHRRWRGHRCRRGHQWRRCHRCWCGHGRRRVGCRHCAARRGGRGRR